MALEKDLFKTITAPNEVVLFKDKNSKFYGYAYPIQEETQLQKYIAQLKKEHHKAGHWCYAYQLGKNYTEWRANDDGEPNNSAGMPIYGQIQSYNLTNILIVVVRYFGGTKLGVSGLIHAYKTTAQMAITACNIITKTIDITYIITCNYETLNKVMRVVKDKKLQIVNQDMALHCVIEIAIRKKDASTLFNLFNSIYGITIIEKKD